MRTLIEKITEQQSSELDRLIKWAGNRSILARHLGTSPQVVAHWVKRGRISAKQAAMVEEISSGAFTKESLRPDVVEWERG